MRCMPHYCRRVHAHMHQRACWTYVLIVSFLAQSRKWGLPVGRVVGRLNWSANVSLIGHHPVCLTIRRQTASTLGFRMCHTAIWLAMGKCEMARDCSGRAHSDVVLHGDISCSCSLICHLIKRHIISWLARNEQMPSVREIEIIYIC